MPRIDDVLAAAEADFENSIARLMDYLRIPSISADPAYNSACLKAAEWTHDMLKDMGFRVRYAETPAHPVVIGHYEPDRVAPKTPHILLYGHYDVQPPDPTGLWNTPPFEPSRRKDKNGTERIYARGACDDKGQLMTIVEASRAWLKAHGQLPCKVTVLIEGDEESDCSHLDDFLAANRADLEADVAFICDTNMWDVRTPAITTRLRGCVGDEVVITGPTVDLHSGSYGGAAANPIHVLTAILADMRAKDGRIRIPGFYDGVGQIPAATRRQWKGLKFDSRKFLKDVGLTKPKGEKGYTVLEQLWARPTAEVNGIIGGYTGEGGKTVIPSKASAKLTFRLVGTQDPVKIKRAFRKFVKARAPEDCKVSFVEVGGEASACVVEESNAYLRKAAQALKDEWGREPVFMGTGGSIPIVGAFRRVLGIDSILAGFSLDEDGAHSPNEKFDVECYRRGIRSWIRIFEAVAG
ncbi:MAG TPA: M20/M25/M40 family metallo-hydrolase [Aestuariivirgaceae bacterium]|nr:M20/M25/M40 family metallo-hydrolase [Aestuariivirgaceae bacterium]